MLDRFVNSRLLRGFIVTLLGSGSSKIILVLTTFYATNNLSLLEFGEFSFIRNTLNTILCICALNFTGLCTKFTAEAYKSPKSYYKLAILFIFSLCICAIIGIVLLLLNDRYLLSIAGKEDIILYLKIIGLFLPFFLLQPLIEGILRGIMRFKLIGILQTSTSILFLLFIIIGIQINGVDGAIFGLLIYYAIYSFLSINILLKQNNIVRIIKFSLHFKKEDLNVLTLMIIPVFLMSFIEAPITWWAQVLLAKYDTMKSIGEMTVILQIRNVIMIIPSYFFSTFMTFAAKMRAERNYVNYFSRFNLIGIFIFVSSIIVVVAFCICGEYILTLYGKEYENCLLAFIVAMSTLPFLLLSNLLKINMVVMEQQKNILLISVVWNLGFIFSLYVLLLNNIESVLSYFYAQGIGIIIMFSMEIYCYLQNRKKYEVKE